MHIKNWAIIYTKKIHYPLITTEDLFNPTNAALLQGGRKEGSRRFVVIDEALYEGCYQKLGDYFKANHIIYKIVPFLASEKNKSIESYLKLFKELDGFPMDRRGDSVIAIGGGVLTDVVAFVASCYRRGVPHIKIPTTLMGYIDASVGIKTGINYEGSKNRMGSFEPPQAVILDRSFLKTLPYRHILNGVSEILKLAVIKDAELFSQLEQHGVMCVELKFQSPLGVEILSRSITAMVEELEPNLYEDQLERLVDFGHTFSHALEMNTQDALLHGEAVAIDIAFSAILANTRGLLSNTVLDRIFRLIKSLGLTYHYVTLDVTMFLSSLVERTYHRDGLQRVPLPIAIGKGVFVNDIAQEEIHKAYHLFKLKYAELI